LTLHFDAKELGQMAYAEAYLDEVVETQGDLFDHVAWTYAGSDTQDFIEAYMRSATRGFIDAGEAYVCTMDADDLPRTFLEVDGYRFRDGEKLEGFLPRWIGEFYAYYQWYFDIPSARVVDLVPISFLRKAYGACTTWIWSLRSERWEDHDRHHLLP